MSLTPLWFGGALVLRWVFEEYVKKVGDKWERPARGASPPEGKTWVDEGYTPLTQVINEQHENVVYLPGIALPPNVVASPDIKECVTDATMMVFVIPHNFLAPIVPKMEVRNRVGVRLRLRALTLCRAPSC